MGGFQECCSLGLAISIIVPVRASPSLLWSVITDFEALPQIVDTVHDVKILRKQSSLHSSKETTSATLSTSNNVNVGMQFCESRRIKNRVLKFRHVVTNIVENPDKHEYSISFNSYLEREFPKSADFLCNTSTLSIVAPPNTQSAPSCCELIGSCAMDYGGAGCCGLASCCIFYPFLLNRLCKRRFERNAESTFAQVLEDFATEAEQRAKVVMFATEGTTLKR